MNKALNYISYLLIRFFMGFFRLLPMSFGFAVARSMGLAGYYLLPGRRRVALENIEMAFGDEKSEAERKRIAKESFINAAYSPMEIIHCSKILVNLDKHFTFEGDDMIDEMVAKKKGFFVFGGHLGSWMLVPMFPVRFLPEDMLGNVVIRPQRNPYFDSYFREYVRGWRGNMINTRGTGDLIEELITNGQMIGLYMDQESRRGQGVFVDFFGRPACSHVVPAYLARKHNIPMFPYWMVRQAPGYVKAIFKKPIEIVNTGDKDADIKVNTQTMVSEIEDAIRKYPEQWFWVHRRWKRQVDGSDREKRKEQSKARGSRTRLRKEGAYVTSMDVNKEKPENSGEDK